ncbi:MAG TPA: inorganic diphosphatase [Acidobacteriota bacterium]|nr:inorganic diphosphatase [Acidobacteriota bacterium]
MKNVTETYPTIGRTVEAVIEVPKGNFIKRRTSGKIEFLFPFPCPFNYGSVRAFLGADGDFLDAAVLGPRLRRGSRVSVTVIGVIGMIDAGVPDNKLICSEKDIGELERSLILLFFKFYATCKGMINICRGFSGSSRCLGWQDARKTGEDPESKAG